MKSKVYVADEDNSGNHHEKALNQFILTLKIFRKEAVEEVLVAQKTMALTEMR